MSRRQITAALTDAVVQYYTKKRYCVNREIGLCKRGRLRADFLAMNMKNEIIIVEVKSCPSDFYTDHKWQKYLPTRTRVFNKQTSLCRRKLGIF